MGSSITAVPLSSGGAGGGLTDAQLRATPVPVDTELPAASALADADPNPTTPRLGANLLGFNGTTWDRIRALANNADAVAVTTLGNLSTLGYNYVFNGTTWDRVRAGTATGSLLVNNPTAANLLATVSGTVTANQGGAWTVAATQSGAWSVTADTELPAASALADADPNPTTSRVGSNLLGFNGTTWDRLRSAGDNADAVAVATLGQLIAGARNYVFNGTTWDRVRAGTATGSLLVNNPTAANFLATVSGTVTADTELPAASALADADPNPTTSRVGSNLLGFNGTTWDRVRSAGDNADAVAVATLGETLAIARGTLFNGTTWDRSRTAPGVTGADSVGGPTASGGALVVAPVTIGGRASLAVPTDVADGQVVNIWTERSGRQRVYNSKRNRTGIFFATTNFTIANAADAATAGRIWLINPVGSTTRVALRRLAFSSSSTATTITATTPIITIERMTFTGTASGATVAAAIRDTTDTAATGTIRTASTGMTITAGNAAFSFQVQILLTAVGVSQPTYQYWPAGPDEDDYIVLRAGEGAVVRQATAGSVGDTRVVNIDIVWEEWLGQ